MRAVVFDQVGDPSDVLHLATIPDPKQADGAALVHRGSIVSEANRRTRYQRVFCGGVTAESWRERDASRSIGKVCVIKRYCQLKPS